jgi:DNA polymerase-4
VAIAPLRSERALILSVSAEARREGIFKGMPLGKAMKFCPDLRVLPPDRDLAGKASQVLAGVVARYTPLWEPSRRTYLSDVTGTARLWGRAKDTANRLRREIKEGLSLSGTVGVASNKMVSSIASRILPSEGVLDVDHGQEPGFMAPLRVNVLPGIGPVRRKILLEELNIILVREIVALDMGRLKLIFGRESYIIHQRPSASIQHRSIRHAGNHPLPKRSPFPGMKTMTRNFWVFSMDWWKSALITFAKET